MKKFLLGLATVAILTGCAGRQAEQARQDSLQRALDSMAREEALRQAELARLDSIRQDSIRQDSIRQDSINMEKKMALNPSLFIKYDGVRYVFKSNIAGTLQSLNFNLISKQNQREELEGWDNIASLMKFSRDLNGRNIEIEYLDGVCDALKLKFDNSVEKNNFIKQIQRLPHFFKDGSNSYSDHDEVGIYIETQGNQITFTRMGP